MFTWYLSFVDTELAATIPLDEQVPGGPSFLGCCIIRCDSDESIMEAATEARRQGCNPGGEVMGWAFPPGGSFPEHFYNRLMSAAEVDALKLS